MLETIKTQFWYVGCVTYDRYVFKMIRFSPGFFCGVLHRNGQVCFLISLDLKGTVSRVATIRILCHVRGDRFQKKKKKRFLCCIFVFETISFWQRFRMDTFSFSNSPAALDRPPFCKGSNLVRCSTSYPGHFRWFLPWRQNALETNSLDILGFRFPRYFACCAHS